jgi:hypothetical protein
MTATPEPPANPSANGPATAPGLPAVEPPSGKHILQMFMVPGLIVGLIVAVLIGFTWMFGGPRTPAEWLKKLKDPNPDVRWRAAADLAQVLLRDKELNSDANFGLELAALLNDTLQSSAEEEKALAARLEKLTDKESRDKEWQKVRAEEDWKKLEAQRNYIMYLSACLGNFTVPVGVPLLKDMVEQTGGMEEHGLTARRWRAAFALANLGLKLSKEYPALSDLRKDTIRQQLEKAAERRDRAKWADPALQWVKKQAAGEGDAMGLDVAFRKVVDPQTSDPYLRKSVALALTFWTGSEAENERIDRILVDLTHDTGAGSDLVAEIESDDPKTISFPQSVQAMEVAYLANRALANRGSPLVRVSMLADMLDEDYLAKNMRGRRKDGSEVTHEAAVVQTLIDTLKAVGELHRKSPETDLSSLRSAVDTLAGNKDRGVQDEAKKLQKALDAK